VLARREIARPDADRKVHVRLVDFARLPEPFPKCDDVFIALGTTIKAAGSREAFRQVDVGFVVAVARAARDAGASRLAIVSALGARARSRVFYNRMKGEAEAAVAALGYETVIVARPSLLLGDRAALGQPARSGEAWAASFAGPMSALLPRGVRPIRARDVAAAMVAALRDAPPGLRVLTSGEMQPRS
jgi:uncharacterized protein YbjT (DUF2867 family)